MNIKIPTKFDSQEEKKSFFTNLNDSIGKQFAEKCFLNPYTNHPTTNKYNTTACFDKNGKRHYVMIKVKTRVDIPNCEDLLFDIDNSNMLYSELMYKRSKYCKVQETDCLVVCVLVKNNEVFVAKIEDIVASKKRSTNKSFNDYYFVSKNKCKRFSFEELDMKLLKEDEISSKPLF